MTEPAPTYQPALPKPAVNLALRMVQLYRLENGRRHSFEMIFNDKEWLLIVDGSKLENLGRMEE